MWTRHRAAEMLLLFVGAGLAGCSNPSGLDSIQVTPTAQTLPVGQTLQLTATGTYGNSKHLSTQDVTSSVSWSSSASSVATVNATGLVTAVGSGTATITANATAYNGPVSSAATVTVTGSGGTASGGSVASIAVIPGAQTVTSPGQTTQFLAIGTTTAGATLNLTNQVVWTSSTTQIATVGATGLATGISQGTTAITALYSNGSGGSVVSASGAFTVSGGTAQKFTALTITPSTQSISASGQPAQLIALGTLGSSGAQQDVTSSPQLKWSSSVPSVATVSSTGVVTGIAGGTTTITAELTNPDSTVVSGSATITASVTVAPEPLLSLTVIPSTVSLNRLQDTVQLLAYGTFSTPPYTRDLTNSPSLTWISTEPNVFPVNTNTAGVVGNAAGVVTVYDSKVGVVILAEATNPDGTVVTATSTVNCPLVLPTATTAGSCYPGSQGAPLLATLTVYNRGADTTNWLVTAPSAAGTPNVLHCGPGSTSGGSVCTASYPIGSTVILTAPATAAAFGGWSYNCVPQGSVTAQGPNSCAVTLTTNETVGAVFN